MPNIGVALEEYPNARARELTKMFMTLLGTWEGSYTYFDERQGQYVSGEGTLEFNKTPMPNVITLDAKTSRPSGPPVHAFTTMVVQADGASWRQMAFTQGGGRIQDKIITGYKYVDDRNWSVDQLEVQQGLGAVSAVTVVFSVKDGELEMKKCRAFEGGDVAAREYESLARFRKVR